MFKSLLMKILGRLALALFVKQKKIDTAGLKTMLINRTDRLGDAIISLPLLLELNKRFDVTVLTSQYNDFVFKGFLKTRIITDRAPTTFEFIKKVFTSLISCGYLRRKNNAIPRYDIYLDLIGIRGLGVFLHIWEENLCRYYIGFNVSIWSLLLDYSYKASVLLSNTNVTTATHALIKDGMGIDLDIPDYIDLTSKMVPPADFSVRPPYLLVNIAGYDKFRGPSPQMYARLINSLEFEGTVVIMDELNRPNIDECKRHVTRENVVYLENNYSIWELLHISKNALLYIGSDSGITNFLHIPTNGIIFFATTYARVWRPYSRNPYQTKKFGKLVIEETVNSAGLTKKVMYRSVWCRPCFDIGCRGHRCIKDMDMQAVASEINSFLHNSNR